MTIEKKVNGSALEIALEGRGHAGMMIAYAAAMGPLPGVAEIVLEDVPESFMELPRTLRSPVFLFGMMKLFDLPQLYRAVRHFHPRTEIRTVGRQAAGQSLR